MIKSDQITTFAGLIIVFAYSNTLSVFKIYIGVEIIVTMCKKNFISLHLLYLEEKIQFTYKLNWENNSDNTN